MRTRTDAAPGFVLADSLPAPGSPLILGPEESHYLARVVRARPGDGVSVTDGAGGLAEVRLTRIASACEGEVVQRTHEPRRRALTLACGAPEGERADWLVEKLAELGVARLQPLDCDRGGWERADQRRERWARLARAALRQSRSRHAMAILPPVAFEQWLTSEPPGCRLLADPSGAAAVAAPRLAMARCAIAVGPSGGFSEQERKAMQENGFQCVALAPSRLRTETAAMAAAALWAAAGGCSG